jgi:hypothetical protein
MASDYDTAQRLIRGIDQSRLEVFIKEGEHLGYDMTFANGPAEQFPFEATFLLPFTATEVTLVRLSLAARIKAMGNEEGIKHPFVYSAQASAKLLRRLRSVPAQRRKRGGGGHDAETLTQDL